MKILVTGGAGFIGSHLCEALIAKGDSVIALDDFSTGNSRNVSGLLRNPRFSLVQGSILDEEKVQTLIEATDGVMHLAAAVGVQKILDDPMGSLTTNIRGSEIVMNCAARLQKPGLIASTSEIYGKNESESLDEESDRILGSPLLSRWTYSESKVIEEAMARILFERKNWQVKIVRFFNTVGPRQTGVYGMVLPRFIESAIKGEPIRVYGDGSQRRVFCHVSDAVAAVMSLWESPVGFGEAFNIGGVEEIGILELAELIVRKCNSKSKITFVPYEELSGAGFEDMMRRVPNTKKIENLTGWKAKQRLDEIIKDTYEFIRSN